MAELREIGPTQIWPRLRLVVGCIDACDTDFVKGESARCDLSFARLFAKGDRDDGQRLQTKTLRFRRDGGWRTSEKERRMAAGFPASSDGRRRTEKEEKRRTICSHKPI